MPIKRIIAHYMNEPVHKEAVGRLASAQDTGAYVIGEVDGAEIPALRNAGLRSKPRRTDRP
jgi:hypothetical protein